MHAQTPLDTRTNKTPSHMLPPTYSGCNLAAGVRGDPLEGGRRGPELLRGGAEPASGATVKDHLHKKVSWVVVLLDFARAKIAFFGQSCRTV